MIHLKPASLTFQINFAIAAYLLRANILIHLQTETRKSGIRNKFRIKMQVGLDLKQIYY